MHTYDHWKTLEPIRRDLMSALIRLLFQNQANPCFILSTALAEQFDWMQAQPEAEMVDNLLHRIEKHFTPLLNRILSNTTENTEALQALERIHQARPDLFSTAKAHFLQMVQTQSGTFDSLRSRFATQAHSGSEPPGPESLTDILTAEDELDLSDVAALLEGGMETNEDDFDFEIIDDEEASPDDDFSLEDSDKSAEFPAQDSTVPTVPRERKRTADAPMEDLAATVGVQPLPANLAPPPKTISKVYERQTTVRYYEKMALQASFPLTVSITTPDVELGSTTIKSVYSQTGATFKIDPRKPLITIVPVIPGCRCVPERIEGDISTPEVHAEFFVSPSHTSPNTQGRVDIIQNGVLIDRIPLTTRIVSQRVTLWTLGLSALTTVAGYVAKGLGMDLATQIQQKFPLLNRVQSVLVDYHLYIAGGGLLIALILFLLMRPRQGDPINNLLNYQTIETAV